MGCHVCGHYAYGPFICTKEETSSPLSSIPCPAKLSYLCFFTTEFTYEGRRTQVSIFHKIGRFSFAVKSGNVSRKLKKKVLGISCFFGDNEFRKDDLLPPSLKKNVYLPFCFPIQTGMITFGRSTFENGF